jgi:peptide/nickel transport system substrate-binding protein
MYTTAYLSTADWNDTRFKVPAFDEMLLSARGELDPAKRKEIYAKMAMMLRDEGGLILPMFNDFISGVASNVGGWVADPTGEMMGNKANIKCWLTA